MSSHHVGPLTTRPFARCARTILFTMALALVWSSGLSSTAFADPEPPGTSQTSPGISAGVSLAERRRLLLPLVQKVTGATSTGARYATIPVLPPPTDRPAVAHADLNLVLRGYAAIAAPLTFVTYGGSADPDAPQLPGIFSDGRTPKFTSSYRVYEWDWSCGYDGCRAAAITNPPVTLLGLAARKGEFLSAPSRAAEIYPGGYVALVLFADEHRITLKYTRDDNVVGGYTAHLENIDVDSNLLALYRQADTAGRAQLPALTNGQPLGAALDSEVRVAVRDCGAFMDPRSRKDWWQGR